MKRFAPDRREEGFIDVEGGSVWFKLVGRSQGVPLVVLHGGPGLPHDYLAPLNCLASQQPVLFYDQLGCGKSDRPTDNGLWSIDRFVSELTVILRDLKIERYHLFGHSYGAMIALEHALRKPQGLRSLIFASPVFSTRLFIRDMNSYRGTLPVEVQKALRTNEEAGTLTSPEFLQATELFYQQHVCRVVPQPAVYVDAASKMGHAVYEVMWGPAEFICTGNLKNYDRTERLKELAWPCLLTCGGWDGVKPDTLVYYQSLIANSRMKVFAKSAHMAHLEETELYLQVVQGFLDEANKDELLC